MIKRLSACIREYKKQTILTPTCMVGEVVCECTIPLLTADLINSIQNGCEIQTILFYGLRLFVIPMLSLGFGSLSGWFAAEAAAGFAKKSAPRSVLSGAGLFVCEYRPVLHVLSRYPADDGRDQYSECVHDADSDRSACADDARICRYHVCPRG